MGCIIILKQSSCYLINIYCHEKSETFFYCIILSLIGRTIYAQEFTEGFFIDDTYVELTKYNENVFVEQ